MARAVGAIERDLDNAAREADAGFAGSGEKLARLRAELADLTPQAPEPEPEPEPEDEPVKASRPKAKPAKK